MPVDACRRCLGVGEVEFAYRRQDDDEWDRRTKPCPVCLGMGTTPPRRGGGWPDGSIHFHVRGGPTRMSMDEIMDRIEGRKPNGKDD